MSHDGTHWNGPPPGQPRAPASLSGAQGGPRRGRGRGGGPPRRDDDYRRGPIGYQPTLAVRPQGAGRPVGGWVQTLHLALGCLVRPDEPPARRLDAAGRVGELGREVEGGELLVYVDKVLPGTEAVLAQATAAPSDDHRQLLAVLCGALVGALGRLGAEAARFFPWVYRQQAAWGPAAAPLLTVLLKVLEQDTGGLLRAAVPSVLAAACTLLDTTASPPVISRLLGLFVLASRRYPPEFSAVFEDMVDMLLGWLIDPATPPALTAQITDALGGLDGYWLEHLAFTLQFMAQVQRDMHEAATKLKAADSKARPTMQRAMLPFIGIFSSMVAAVSSELCPQPNTPNPPTPARRSITPAYLSGLASAASGCYEALATTVAGPDTMITAHNMVRVVARATGSHFAGHAPATLQHALKVLGLAPTTPLLASTLDMMRAVVQGCGKALPETFVHSLLEPSSHVAMSCLASAHCTDTLLAICADIFAANSMPLCELALTLLADLTQTCYESVLLQGDGQGQQAHEAGAVFCSHVLGQVVGRHALVGLWAQQLLAVLAATCCPAAEALAASCPAAQAALVRALATVARSCSFFLPLRKFKANKDSAGSGVVVGLQAAGGLDSVVHVWAQLLADTTVPLATVMLVVDWLRELASAVVGEGLKMQAECQAIACSAKQWRPLINTLCANVVGCEGPVQVASSQCLLGLLQAGLVPWQCMANLAAALLPMLGHACADVRTAAVMTYAALPSWVTRYFEGECMDLAGPRAVLHRLPPATLRPAHFTAIMANMLGLGLEDTTATLEDDWLLSLFYGSQAAMADQPAGPVDGALSEAVGRSRALVGLWAANECARFCVLARLRTPYGGPKDTLETLERCLHELAARQKGGHLKGEDDPSRAMLVLLFMELLERHMANAMEGFATVPGVPKNVTAFFQANAKVSREWLGRVRPVLLMLACTCAMPSVAVRQGLLRLGDLHALLHQTDTQQPAVTVLQVQEQQQAQAQRHMRDATWSLLLTAEAMLLLKDTEGLQGLQSWTATWQLPGAATHSGGWAGWLGAYVQQAEGRYEEALQAYRVLLDTQGPEIGVREVLQARTNECCAALWWRHSPQHPTMEGPWAPLGDLLSALGHYDDGQLQAAEQAIHTATPYEGPWLEGRLHGGQQQLLLGLTALRRAQPCSGLLGNAVQQLQAGLEGVLVHEPPCLVARHSQALLLAAILGQTDGKAPASSVLGCWDPVDVASVLPVCRAAQALQDNAGLHETLLAGARAGRRQGNLQAARQLLDMAGTGHAQVAGWVAMEQARVLQAGGKVGQAVQLLAGLLTHSAPARADGLQAKALRRMVHWLEGTAEADRQTLLGMLPGHLTKLLAQWPGAYPATAPLTPLQGLLAPEELQLGACVWLSSKWAPDHAQASFQYGAWCYGQAKHMEAQLAADPMAAIRGTDRDTIKAVLAADPLLDQAQLAQAEEDIAKVLAGATVPSSSLELDSACRVARGELEGRLGQGAGWQLSGGSVQQLQQLHEGMVARLVALDGQAARAFMAYLQLAATSPQAATAEDDARQDSRNQSSSLLAVLRLLHLLLKHGMALAHVFSDGLLACPALPWRLIVPQLFARLGDASSYVRGQVAGLLCRVGQACPQVIAYPALVGLKGQAAPGVLQAQLGLVLSSLRAHAPTMVAAVSALIDGLARLAELWDERWLDALSQLQADAARRLARVADTTKRLLARHDLNHDAKVSCLRNYYEATMGPLWLELERIERATIAMAPDTPHEQRFEQEYGPQLRQAIKQLRSPSTAQLASPDAMAAAWRPLLEVQHRLARQVQRRGASKVRLGEVSPHLLAIDTSAVTVPGQLPADREGSAATIVSFVEDVVVLPTKTRPKRIGIMGSDGREHWYLYKGVEDMHLDERIMQLMAATHTLLARHLPRPNKSNMLGCHSTVVIPLGKRSGLIQWVDHVVPMFGLYKRWQQRSASSGQAVGRPVDVFSSKVVAVLRKRGLPDTSPRKDWPAALLLRVWQELVGETPSDLLSRELWAASCTPTDWCRARRRYVQTSAVMSMVGYVIGLGDRHLDNMLCNYASGQVLHVDFNVCFEKGLRLRVPECVPFRMTHNLQHALGPAGINGSFRVLCTQVLGVLREHREVLLLLLEAFVYDPLVDWTLRTDDKEKTELAVTSALKSFGAHMAEHQHEWDARHDQLVVRALPRLLDTLTAAVGLQWQVVQTQQAVGEWEALPARLRQAAEGLRSGLDQHRALKGQMDQLHSEGQRLQQQLQGQVDQWGQWLAQYAGACRVLASVDLLEAMLPMHLRTALPQHSNPDAWLQAVAAAAQQGPSPASTGVPEQALLFLQSVGQPALADELGQQQSELHGLQQQQAMAATTCVHVLGVYAHAMGLLCPTPCLPPATPTPSAPPGLSLAQQQPSSSELALLQTAVPWCLAQPVAALLAAKDTNARLAACSTAQGAVQELGNLAMAGEAVGAAVREAEAMLAAAVTALAGEETKLCGLPPPSSTEYTRQRLQQWLDGEDGGSAACVAAAGTILHEMAVRHTQSLQQPDVWSLPELCGCSASVLGLVEATGPQGPLAECLGGLRAARALHVQLAKIADHFRASMLPQLIAAVPQLQHELGSGTEAFLSALTALGAEAVALAAQQSKGGDDLQRASGRLWTRLQGMLQHKQLMALRTFDTMLEHLEQQGDQGMGIGAAHSAMQCQAMLLRIQLYVSVVGTVLRVAPLLPRMWRPGDRLDGLHGAVFKDMLLGSYVHGFCYHYYVKRHADSYLRLLGRTTEACMLLLAGDDQQQVMDPEQALKAAIGRQLAAGTLGSSQLGQAHQLLQAHMASLAAQAQADTTTAALQAVQATSTVAQWLVLRLQWANHGWLGCTRGAVLVQAQQAAMQLAGLQLKVQEAADRMAAKEADLANRLAWAAATNRALATVHKATVDACQARRQELWVQQQHGKELVEVVGALLHMERHSMPRGDLGLVLLQQVGSVVAQYQGMVAAYQQLALRTQDTDAMLQLAQAHSMDPASKQSVQAAVDAAVAKCKELQGQLKGLSGKMARQGADLSTVVVEVRECLADSAALMKDARPLLANIAKAAAQLAQDPSAGAIQSSAKGLVEEHSQFCTALQQYCNSIGADKDQGSVVAAGLLGSGPEEAAAGVQAAVSGFIRTAEQLHAQTMALAQAAQPATAGSLEGVERPLSPGLVDAAAAAAASVALQGAVPRLAVSPALGTLESSARALGAAGLALASPAIGPQASSQQQDHEQGPNSHAVSVWHRVRAKLEGRDGCEVAVDVDKQVEQLLQAATCPDNLSRMYEGWMPWI